MPYGSFPPYSVNSLLERWIDISYQWSGGIQFDMNMPISILFYLHKAMKRDRKRQEKEQMNKG